jgi:SAM-dependent methyltransferase
VGQSVLEIGPGYGSVTRRLSRYTDQVVALDIAPGPVGFAAATTDRTGCVRGSALALPFADATLDNVVVFGSLHHTSNMELALRECMRVLRPGGRLIAMVYHRHSYKRWIVSPIATLRSVIDERRGDASPESGSVSRRVSWFRDHSPDGSAPPHTEFATRSQLHQSLQHFVHVNTTVINVDNVNDLAPMTLQGTWLDNIRVSLPGSPLSRLVCLDLYVVAVKS